MLLAGRSILITNVNHFAGIAASTFMAKAGATMLCHDASFEDAAARAAFEASADGLVALSEQDHHTMVAEAIHKAGEVDVLINNDAFPAIRAKIEDADVQDMRDGLEAMVVDGFVRTGAIVPHFKDRKGGKIIFLTSASAFVGLKNYSMYASARAAAHGLVLSLAKELASYNIQVNAIAPNFIENPDYFPPELLANEEAFQKIVSNIPLGRLGKPEEIAALIAFYASNQSDFITGNLMPFAGGWA